MTKRDAVVARVVNKSATTDLRARCLNDIEESAATDPDPLVQNAT